MKTPPVLLAAVTALLLATPAQAEIASQSPTGFAVVHEREVTTDPDATFAMLRTPARWWAKEHSWTGNADNFYLDASAGGCFCEQIPAPEGQSDLKRGSVEHARVIYANPGKMLRMSGAFGPLQSEAVTGVLTIALTPSTKGTIVRFEYVVGGYMRMDVAEIAPAVDTVIGQQLSRFANALGPVVKPIGAPATKPVPIAPKADAPKAAPAKPAPVPAAKSSTPATKPKDLPPNYVPSVPPAKAPAAAKPDFTKLMLEGLYEDAEPAAAEDDATPAPK